MTALELARFALYADLGMAFGVPAAAVLTGAQFALDRLRPLLVGAVVIGLPLSVVGYLLTVAEMAGTGLVDIDRQLAVDLAIGTALGWSFLTRMAALVVSVGVCCSAPRRLILTILPLGIAAATLAWSGHAAASEGDLALMRIGGDIVHLLVASTWLGALVLFLALLSDPAGEPDFSGRVLARFAGIGTVLVVLLGVSGLSNLAFIAPLGTWKGLITTRYGQLLAIKLMLFLGMLILAGLNRLVFAPRLVSAVDRSGTARSLRTIRLSIALEFCAALVILLLVSQLGLLDPGLS